MLGVPKQFSDFFSQLGISQESLLKIHFGGVVGKQALISVSGIIGLGFLAYRTTDSSLHWGCLIGILALGFFGLGAVGFHGHKHPIEATLEGGEVVAWQQIQHAMAAKDMPRVPESPPVMEGLGQKRIGEKGANT